MAASASGRLVGLVLLALSLPVFVDRPLAAAARRGLRKGNSRNQTNCRIGMFDDRQQGAVTKGRPNCRPCSKCISGYGVSRLCTRYNDTECARCPAGTYSASISQYDDCVECRRCAAHLPTVRPCTSASDTVCSTNCTHGYFYNAADRDCLPCSPCPDGEGAHGGGDRVPECTRAGLPAYMQCRPRPGQRSVGVSAGGGTGDDHNSDFRTAASKLTTAAAGDPTAARAVGGAADGGAYTAIIVALLAGVGLCAVFSLVLVVCFCRVLRRVTRQASAGRPARTKRGYHNISVKTSELLIKGSTYV